MKKPGLLFISTFLIILIIGCNTSDNRNIQAGKLILHHDQINTVEIIKAPSDTNKINLTDSSYISELLNIIAPITLTKLAEPEDADFMSKRMLETHFTVYFDNCNDTSSSIQGCFLIWPDGQIYAVDVESMVSNQRTVSYVSQTKYPEVYEWANEKLINMSSRNSFEVQIGPTSNID